MGFSLQSTGFSDALVILGAAGLVIPAFARARINPVIGFILVGALVGPAGLGRFTPEAPWLFYVTISDPHGIEPFAEFGIVLLLFSIGLELSFRRLWAMRRAVFGVGAAELGVGAAAIAGVGVLLGYPPAGAIGLALALALSSTALVISIAGTETPVGRAAFAMLLFEDLALVPIIFALGALKPDAGGSVWAAMGWTLLKGGGAVAALLIAGRLALPRVFAQAARTKSPELFLAASLLVVILASIATSAAGLSPIVGALVAGVLIAETEYLAEVEVITAPFKGLALGIFLITVGMRLDLQQVAGHWPALLAATAGVIVIKGVVTGGLLRLLGFRPGLAAETSLLMAAPSETTLIVLATATGAGLIAAPTAAFWQICTALGLTVTPLLALAGRLVARLLDRRQPVEPVGESETADHIVVVGYGRVGQLVVDMLRRHDRTFSVIDADVDAVARARADGVPIRFGDVRRPQMFEQLGLADARAIVLTMDDPVQLVRTAAAIRRLHPDLPIVARARHTGHAAELYRAGATEAVPETLEASLQLSGAVLVEVGVAMGPVVASIHTKRAELRDAILKDGEGDRALALRRW